MTMLDPKFAKVVALMRSSTHAGEQEAARGRAEAMASAAGMTLDEALALGTVPAATMPNLFDGFDDWMEAREPGHKARCAADRLKRDTARRKRAAAIVARYGSADAALAPCDRERLLQAALKSWITWCEPPHERWTHDVDGWDHFKMEPHIREAVANAYPLPSTFAEAMAERAYWHARDDEMRDVLDDDCGDYGLDRPAVMRMRLVENLAEHEISVTTLQDLHARLVMLREDPTQNDAIEAALFRDVEAMARREREAAASPAAPASPPVHSAGGQIEALLRAHPDWPDRRIARDAGCSPTTVGKVRRAIGATAATRSVHRCGQTYSVRMEAER